MLKRTKIEQEKKVLYPFTIRDMIMEALEELEFANICLTPDSQYEEGMNYRLEFDYNGKHYKGYPCFVWAEKDLDIGPGSQIPFFVEEVIEVEFPELEPELYITIILDYPKAIRHLFNRP